MSRRTTQRSAARERLLLNASRLFYAEGIATVGVNRIVSESHVTLATFYRHFPSKDDLVVAYLNSVHDAIATREAARTSVCEGADHLRALRDQVISELEFDGFRGCAFMNAASEFEVADSPVRRSIASHRQWYYDTVRGAFVEAGHARPTRAARRFVMLRDGAITGGALGDARAAKRTFVAGVDDLLRPNAEVPSRRRPPPRRVVAQTSHAA